MRMMKHLKLDSLYNQLNLLKVRMYDACHLTDTLCFVLCVLQKNL